MKPILSLLLFTAILSAHCINSDDEGRKGPGDPSKKVKKKVTFAPEVLERLRQLGIDDDEEEKDDPKDQEEPQGAAGGHPEPTEGPRPEKGEDLEEAEEPQGAAGPHPEKVEDVEELEGEGFGEICDSAGYRLIDTTIDTKHKENAANSYYQSLEGIQYEACDSYTPKPGFIYKTVFHRGIKVWEAPPGVRCTLIQYCHILTRKIMYLDLTDGSQLIMKRKGNRWKLKGTITPGQSDETEAPTPRRKRWRKK